MTVNWITAFLDTPRSTSDDAEAFWLAVTGTDASARRGVDGEFVTLIPSTGDAVLRSQVIVEGAAGVHLDLHVADVHAAAAASTARGARILVDHGALVVAESPGGLAFCIVEDPGGHERPEPVAWSGGRCSVLDQVCLDIPVHDFDTEARFWSDMTGLPLRPGSRPEFAYLVRPRHHALRLLLQRVDGRDRTRAHLDLACDDVPVEAARHLDLGARVVRRESAWTTLTDPAGREYCITARDPRTGLSRGSGKR